MVLISQQHGFSSRGDHDISGCAECCQTIPKDAAASLLAGSQQLQDLDRHLLPSTTKTRRDPSARIDPFPDLPNHETVPQLDWESCSEDETMDTTSSFRNHYLTLGLSVTAKLADIRTRYLGLVARLEQESAEKRPAKQRMDSAVNITSIKRQEKTIAHPKSEAEHAACQCQAVLQSAEAIVRRNALDDAWSILAHPVRRKAYDSTYLHELQQYEKSRISRFRPAGRAVALADAAKWRTLLQKGCKSALDAKMMGDLGWAAWSLEMYGEHEKAASATSMMSGEVVAGFVDLMEV